MSGKAMLHLAFALGVLFLAMALLAARFRTRNRLCALLSLVFRFSCLLIGTAATAYWAAAPGGPHPISACGSAFLLLAYVVSGETSIADMSPKTRNE
jgi:hypothetical protein